MKRRTITEKYDEQGRLTERTIVEEDVAPLTTWTTTVYPQYQYPYYQPTIWYTQGGGSITGGGGAGYGGQGGGSTS
jgi:hypothetical protein